MIGGVVVVFAAGIDQRVYADPWPYPAFAACMTDPVDLRTAECAVADFSR